MEENYAISNAKTLFGNDENVEYKIDDENHELKLCEYCNNFFPYENFMYNVSYCFHCWSGHFYEPVTDNMYGDFEKEIVEPLIIKHYATHCNNLCLFENCLFNNICKIKPEDISSVSCPHQKILLLI